MPTPTDHPTRLRLRTKVAVASIAVAVAGATSLIALNGSASADRPERPAITVGTVIIPEISVFATLPPFTLLTVPLPTGLTIPPFTSVTVPPGDTTTTTSPETTTTTTPTDTTDATDTTETATTDGVSSPAAPPDELAVDITNAQINCDGTIHVEFDTLAVPQPVTAANHLVVINPTSNPAAFSAVETSGNPANGSFIFNAVGSVADTYRLFVIALFDPANPDGPKAIDEADVLLASNC